MIPGEGAIGSAPISGDMQLVAAAGGGGGSDLLLQLLGEGLFINEGACA